MTRKFVTLCALTGAFCAGAFGEGMNVKPGLWETTTAAPAGSAAMPGLPPEALAKMTPEQRAQVEAMMKARGMGRMGQPTVTKSCVTEEQLSKPMTFGQDNNGMCKMTLVSSTRSRQEMAMTCDNQNFKATGTLVIETQNSEHYTGKLQVQADPSNAGGRGAGMAINRDFTGKWLGSDCGDLKPRAAPNR